MPANKTARHPGTILASDYLAPRGLSQYRVAVDTAVPPRRINEIVLGKRGITADTALRLGRYFDVDPLTFTELQARWDLDQARKKLGNRLETEITPHDARQPKPSTPRPRSRPPEPEVTPVTAPALEDYLL